jgi:5-methylcytosine-specific restriction endonuclease McrA
MSDPRYSTDRWRRLRKNHLAANPLCRMCLDDSGRIVQGRQVDHIKPHRGNDALFWNGALQTLCDTHHSASKQREEVHGYSSKMDENGFPTDPLHPFNQQTRK